MSDKPFGDVINRTKEEKYRKRIYKCLRTLLTQVDSVDSVVISRFIDVVPLSPIDDLVSIPGYKKVEIESKRACFYSFLHNMIESWWEWCKTKEGEAEFLSFLKRTEFLTTINYKTLKINGDIKTGYSLEFPKGKQ